MESQENTEKSSQEIAAENAKLKEKSQLDRQKLDKYKSLSGQQATDITALKEKLGVLEQEMVLASF